MPYAAAVHRSFVLALVLLAGCGARTGLRVPDGGVDASVRHDLGIDAFRPPPPPPLCIEVPRTGGPVTAQLATPVALSDVDVMFVLDSTGSIQRQIGTIRARLRDVVAPGIRAVLPGAWMGLAFSGEFQVVPYSNASTSNLPYALRLPLTSSEALLEGALDMPPNWRNHDAPEAYVEALYQTITGEGLLPFVDPSFGCASGGTGGACFREDALPVIVLVGDAPFHNGPPDLLPAYPYDASLFPPGGTPHLYADLLRAARAADVRVVGLGITHSTRNSPMPYLQRIARDSGAVDADGNALAFDAGPDGANIETQVVGAVQQLAAGLPVDVTARVDDVPGDAVDVRTLVTALRPFSADPPSGITGTTADAFTGVRPGTRVTFQLVLDTSSLPPATETRRYPAHVVFFADGRSVLGRVDVVIEIPGVDGGNCDAGAE